MIRYELCYTTKKYNRSMGCIYEGITTEFTYEPIRIGVYEKLEDAKDALKDHQTEASYENPYYTITEYWIEEDSYDESGEILSVKILEFSSFEEMCIRKLSGLEWGDLNSETRDFLLKKRNSDYTPGNIGQGLIDLSVPTLFVKGIRLGGNQIHIPDNSIIQTTGEGFT